MKNFSKIFIALIFVFSSFILGGNFLYSGQAFAVADLTDYTQYYSVRKEYLSGTTAEGEKVYAPNSSDPKFKDGEAILLKSTERVAVILGQNNVDVDYSYIDEIRNLTYSIKINDNLTFGDTQDSAMESYGIEIKVDDGGKKFVLYADPSEADDGKSFIYGKYTIEFSYIFFPDGINEKQVQFTSSMYILNYADYNRDSFSYMNMVKIDGYYSDNTSYELPYLEYNYKNYNLEIVRSYKGLSTTTKATYNGEVLISSLNESLTETNTHNVSYVYSDSLNKAYVTFKNLGSYYLTFTPINPGGQNEAITSFYQEKLELKQMVHNFGFVANYTSQDGLMPFMQSSSEELVWDGDEIVKAPWKIASTKYNSNITPFASAYSSVEDMLDAVSQISVDTIAKTNQAPIYFETNASLIKEESLYYYFKDASAFEQKQIEEDGNVINYQAEPLSKAGIYFVKLTFSYAGRISEKFSQYFLFRITNDAPSVEIYTQETTGQDTVKVNINNGEYTYKDVFISKFSLDVFDSVSTLMVYKDVAFDGSYDEGVEVLDETLTFTETAKYKVQLKYGSDGKKGFITYFVIDKSPIEEIVFHNLNKTIGSSYTIGKELNGNLITDQAVSLSWKPKASGATVFAEYKFFPTTYSASNVSTLTSAELGTLYNSQQYKHSIPSTHILNYSGGVVPVDEYENTYEKRLLLESEVLSAGGLYIFKLYDITGNEPVYYSVFIDKTPNSILTTNGSTYNIAINNDVSAEDISVLFGKTKFIKILSNIIADEWLNNYLTNNNSAQYKNQKYLTIPVNNKVYYTKDSVNVLSEVLTQSSGKYGYGIDLSAQNNESQYIFYTICESSNAESLYQKDSIEYYKENYSATHTIRFTSDNSRMSVYYIENEATREFEQLPTTTSPDNTYKVNYFQPSGANFETLYLTYCVSPKDDLQVKSIVVNYYAFEPSGDMSKPSLKFASNPTATITIYENGVLLYGEEVNGLNGTYIYNINTETYNSSSTRTKAGKYEIIRQYTDDSVIIENDPKGRNIVFIVDRNEIVEEPTINNLGQATYYVGSGIQLQIINSFGTSYYTGSETLHYYDIYYATKLNQATLAPILTTNFLPVTVYIPTFKYGYIQNVQGYPTFVLEDSIGKYKTPDGKDAYYSNYELSAVVEHYENSSLDSLIKTYNFNVPLSGYNFLTTSDNPNSITSFNQEGYYRVNIKSNAGNKFSFVFRIQYQEPNYELLDSGNTAINTDGEVYYTSKDTIRISWEDSSSPYLARINKNEIKFTINGATHILDIEKCKVKSAGENKYYVEVNLSDFKSKDVANGINGFYHNSIIDITLQFNGRSEDYNNSTYFSKTKRLIIDLEAPTSNITRLIAETGLNAIDLREYVDGNKYYISKSSGLLRNFAYTVDLANFNDLIKASSQTDSDYYRIFYRLLGKNGVNVKYTGSSKDGETDITISGFAGQMDGIIGGNTVNTFANTILNDEQNIGTYIEFVEEDYAGNRTIYTIYLSNILSDTTKTAFTYKSLNNTAANEGNVVQPVEISRLGSELNLYSKRSFNLESINFIDNNKIGNLYWQVITIGDDKYIKSPYRDKYFKYNAIDEVEYALAELSLLGSSSNAQRITLNMVPYFSSTKINVFVLNKTLEYYTLSQVMENNMYEGLLVRIPETKETETNVLYAKKITIKSTLGGGVTYTIEEDFLRVEQEKLPELSNLKLSYTTYKGNRYFQVEIADYIAPNDYFVYTITDNFGEVYSFVHIYGQTEIKESVISEGYVVQTYNEDGSIVYYSSENIEYRFDTTIYEKVNISINLSRNAVVPINYVISKNGNNFIVTNKGDNKLVERDIYEQYFKLTIYSNVLCVTLFGTQIDFSEAKYGGCRNFMLELVPKEVFKIDPLYMNFEIYNELPNTLKIMGKESAVDVTSILNGNVAFAGEVVINYIYTKLAHDYELLIMNQNGEILALSDGMQISEDGTYRIIINYLGDINGCSKSFDFTIANGEKFAYSVVKRQADGTYKTVNATGKSFTYTIGGVSETITTHFIVNDNRYDIVLNSNLYLQNTIEKMPADVDGYTYIHKISNMGTEASDKGLITEYYSSLIAVSVIVPEKKGDLLNRLVHYGENVKEESNGDLLTFATPQLTPYAIDKEQYNSGSRIAWSKYNIIPENIILAEIYFGDIDGAKYNAKIEDYNGLNSIVLKTSGTYYIKFVDLAGNTQLFGAYSDNEYFTIRYLSSVIFEVENENPINYAIYDKPINITVPETTLSYYVINGKPTINVEYNGEEFTDYEKVSEYSWNFTKPGLYKVWFSAKIKSGNGGLEDQKDEQIYEQPLFFTILSSKESRLAYTYSGYSNYYIEDIKLNGESKNEILANINNGDLLSIDGKNYLKEISLHANDLKTGLGSWTFVVNTNNEFDQKFEFTIWINKPKVPLILSTPSGSETTDIITIKFNTQNVLDQAGDCILKISGYDDLILTQELLDNQEIDELYELTIDKKGGYYIEITTLSGHLLYSAYLVKNEPLNTISIIIIVVVSVVLIVATILFIRLRKRMKIR